MAAIGREGGHSRGARARAATTTAAAVGVAAGAAAGAIAGAAYAARHNHDTDIAQGTGSQPFVRQANEDRGSFETGNRNSTSGSGFGSQDDRFDNDRNRRF